MMFELMLVECCVLLRVMGVNFVLMFVVEGMLGVICKVKEFFLNDFVGWMF